MEVFNNYIKTVNIISILGLNAPSFRVTKLKRKYVLRTKLGFKIIKTLRQS